MMSKTMTVTDAHLRLDQLKNGRIPSKETPLLGNPIYQKAYDGFLRFGALCNTLREGTDGAGGFLVPTNLKRRSSMRSLKRMCCADLPLSGRPTAI